MEFTIKARNMQPPPVAALEKETEDDHAALFFQYPGRLDRMSAIYSSGSILHDIGGNIESLLAAGATPIYPGDEVTIKF